MTTGKNGSQEIETRIGTLEFTHDFANGFPTDATIEKLYDERDFQRACQAYLWSLPAVSFAAWQRGVSKGLGARNGQPTEPYFDRSWPLPDFEQIEKPTQMPETSLRSGRFEIVVTSLGK